MSSLEDEFKAEMLANDDKARRLDPPCRSRHILRKIAELGAVETARELLDRTDPASGFNDLYASGGPDALKLSIEYLALRPRFCSLFTSEQLAFAKERLKEHRCVIPTE
jgi:hypothetical protein